MAIIIQRTYSEKNLAMYILFCMANFNYFDVFLSQIMTDSVQIVFSEFYINFFLATTLMFQALFVMQKIRL